MFCRACGGTRKLVDGRPCPDCGALGLVPPEVAKEQALATGEAFTTDEQVTRMPCEACLCCQYCQGSHTATAEANARFRSDQRAKALSRVPPPSIRPPPLPPMPPLPPRPGRKG